ncbi:hypothetical protein ONZ45_g18094 [Pleurotus djamor]|nr:hypothetical protein ONZ45_g18094 [Pleurotus djamor]
MSLELESKQLLRSPLFQLDSASLPPAEQVRISYERTKAIVQLYNLSSDDILLPTKKYWNLLADPLAILDFAAGTLLTIHYNLCCGTLAMHAKGNKEITNILERLLAFDIVGQFCLTEVGHGLDAINIETEARLQGDGTFILNTPLPRAAKFMPPTSPSGIPCVAVVFARLVVDGEDRSVRPFLVSLNDGRRMSPGVMSKVLPPRGAAHYVEHCITSFNNVRLPPFALLGSLEKPKDIRGSFFTAIDRVIVGSLSMAALCIPGLKVAASMTAQYSKLRHVTDASTRLPRPIISFPTQQIPIFTAIAQALVFESTVKSFITIFSDPATSHELRHCIAAIAKATIIPQVQASHIALSERLGARGLFAFNQIITIHSNNRGKAIAEGDTLVLSIRFAVDILLGRVNLPSFDQPNSYLACHEATLLEELQDAISLLPQHRSKEFERMILPRCQPLLEAIGNRLAYEAARRDNVNEDIVNLYVSSCFKQDPAWYTERGGISLAEQKKLERDSVARLSPQLDQLLKVLDVDEAVTAPISSNDRWEHFVEDLVTYDGGSSVPVNDSGLVSHL